MAWAWMPYLLLLFWVLFFFQYSMIISLEEEFLAREFGDAYSKYCAAVPRILPRFTELASQSVETMPLARAMQTEKSTLTSFTLVSLAIFLRWVF